MHIWRTVQAFQCTGQFQNFSGQPTSSHHSSVVVSGRGHYRLLMWNLFLTQSPCWPVGTSQAAASSVVSPLTFMVKQTTVMVISQSHHLALPTGYQLTCNNSMHNHLTIKLYKKHKLTRVTNTLDVKNQLVISGLWSLKTSHFIIWRRPKTKIWWPWRLKTEMASCSWNTEWFILLIPIGCVKHFCLNTKHTHKTPASKWEIQGLKTGCELCEVPVEVWKLWEHTMLRTKATGKLQERGELWTGGFTSHFA